MTAKLLLVSGVAAVAAIGAAAAGMISVALGVAPPGRARVQVQPVAGTYAQDPSPSSYDSPDDPPDDPRLPSPTLPPPGPPPPEPTPTTPPPQPIPEY
jgi:periplasmic protein TonB